MAYGDTEVKKLVLWMLTNIVNNSDVDLKLVISSGIVSNIAFATSNCAYEVKKEAIIVIANLIFKSDDIEGLLLNYELDSLIL